MNGLARVIVCVVVALGTLVACGESDEDRAAGEAAEASVSAEASASAAAEAREEKQEAQQEAQRLAEKRDLRRCVTAIKPLRSALDQIDSRLAVGLSYDDLGDRLGNARVAYDSINFKRLHPKCTYNPGIALESAMNQYIESLNRWQTCIDDYSCQVEGEVLRQLRAKWSQASKNLNRVDGMLRSPAAFADTKDPF